MAEFIELKFPPGIYRAGTALESKGRYYDANLVRWPDGWLAPVRGWRVRSDAAALTGKARAMIAWRDNDGERRAAIGTHSKLYAQANDGDVTDITPVGFTAGLADAEVLIGYGYGAYGAGAYGTPRPDTGVPVPATVWTLDTWGEYLVGCSNADGKLYEWQLDIGTPAAVIANAPEDCQALVTTDERILFALAAGDNARKVQWSDQEDNTAWTPSITNQAGDFELKTAGQLMAGKTLKTGTLLLTSIDAWMATYVGYPLVYGFERVGVGCGLIAPQAVVQIDDVQACWMARDGFWIFNGYAQTINCDVWDYVYSNLNVAQMSKVSAVHQSGFGEVWWFYPSSASNEIDSYVVWCYRNKTWNYGSLVRLCGIDRGVFSYPMMVGSDGLIYEHEVGNNYDGATPYAKTGPIELSPGDFMMEVSRYVPDDKTLGNSTLTLDGQVWSNSAITTVGPITVSSPTDFLFQTRLLSLTYTFIGGPGDRIGIPKIAVTQGDPI